MLPEPISERCPLLLPPCSWTFVIGQSFLTMLCTMEYGVFFMFCGFVVLMTLFVMLFVPETKGVPVEEMDVVMLNKHWFWSRVVAGAEPAPSVDPIPVAQLKASLQEAAVPSKA